MNIGMVVRLSVVIAIVTMAMHAENTNNSTASDFVLLDQIEVVVYGQEDVEIITKSDLDRPSLGGGFRTKDEIIFEREVLLDAKKHHLPQDEEAIDAYLIQIQREHNLSEKELEEIFTSSGYTIEEGRQQLQMLQTINTMLDVKIRSNLIVPRKDVEEYYNNNPVMIEATYTLQRAFVPQSKKMSPEKQYAVLEKYAQTEKGVSGIIWGDAFTISHADIAENKHFIYTMELGQISLPQAINDGFELFKLIDKVSEQVRSLEDSYREIVDILRRPKYEELMENYRNLLLKNASIVYL
ncbi:MAG TPA: peptidyl-prolyl cis-trans isomerase [Candidatus Babeliales bacterium]|nr:peptidyl-prolyl cis-trans isomerase [Candidatus Babeliales bacterium]